VASYASLLEHPERWADAVTDFLSSAGLVVEPLPPPRSAAVDPGADAALARVPRGDVNVGARVRAVCS
jgi:hypothetical protein